MQDGWLVGLRHVKLELGFGSNQVAMFSDASVFLLETKNHENYHNNGKWTRIEDVFPIENMNIPLLCRQFTGG